MSTGTTKDGPFPRVFAHVTVLRRFANERVGRPILLPSSGFHSFRLILRAPLLFLQVFVWSKAWEVGDNRRDPGGATIVMIPR